MPTQQEHRVRTIHERYHAYFLNRKLFGHGAALLDRADHQRVRGMALQYAQGRFAVIKGFEIVSKDSAPIIVVGLQSLENEDSKPGKFIRIAYELDNPTYMVIRSDNGQIASYIDPFVESLSAGHDQKRSRTLFLPAGIDILEQVYGRLPNPTKVTETIEIDKFEVSHDRQGNLLSIKRKR